MSKGFIYRPPLENEWIQGSGRASKKFGATPLMLNGHGWRKYLPKSEKQRKNNLETMACTIFASLTGYEMLANRLGYKDFPQNCSERFSGVLADISLQGAVPHDSLEAIRIWGVIPESVLPFSENIHDWLEFYSPDPMSEDLIKLAEGLLRKYEFGHEYVMGGPEELKNALSRGPVCASVNAWNKEGVFYVKRGPDNHWILIVDYKDGEYWEIEDQYLPFTKKVSWDTKFETKKLLFLKKNESGRTPQEKNYLFFLIGRALNLLKKLWEKS